MVDDLMLGTAPEQARGGPVGLGFRVPMIVASPWSRGGWVNSEVSDATSTIRFLEQFVAARFGVTVTEPNISQWRRSICGDLTSCFHPFETDSKPLDYIGRDDHVRFIHSLKGQPLPVARSDMTRHTANQEVGVRPSCALPYELEATCWMDVDAGELMLEMTAGTERFGSAAAGGAFNAYLYNVKTGTEVYSVGSAESRMATSSYAVAAGDQLRTSFPADNLQTAEYKLAIHGPNGFYRLNQGLTSGDPLHVTIVSEKDGQGGWADHIVLQLVNNNDDLMQVEIHDPAYGASKRVLKLSPKARQSVVIDVSRSGQWYDLKVTVVGDPVFIRHLAGRWENGSHQVTDPLMGYA